MHDFSSFVNLLKAADPKVKKFSGSGAENYTTWQPVRPSGTSSDDEEDEVTWSVQVDRYTKIDDDSIAQAIYDGLKAAHIPFEYQMDFDKETKYIRHIFDCTV